MHNTLSLSLYASLGFAVKEPIAFLKGKPKDPPSGEAEVRPLKTGDLEACGGLCRRVHGRERIN